MGLLRVQRSTAVPNSPYRRCPALRFAGVRTGEPKPLAEKPAIPTSKPRHRPIQTARWLISLL